MRFLLCFLSNGIGRLPFLCFCQLCSLSSCEVGKTGSTSVPRPIRGSFWVSRCGRTGTWSVCLPPPAGVLPLEPGPAQRLGPSGAGRRASAAGPGPPRVNGAQTASFCCPAQGVPPPWIRPCWPGGAPLPGRGLVRTVTGQTRSEQDARSPHCGRVEPLLGQHPLEAAPLLGFPVRGTRCPGLAPSVCCLSLRP